jgi:hypothetical protein
MIITMIMIMVIIIIMARHLLLPILQKTTKELSIVVIVKFFHPVPMFISKIDV